jgi:hypothetical protein
MVAVALARLSSHERGTLSKFMSSAEPAVESGSAAQGVTTHRNAVMHSLEIAV